MNCNRSSRDALNGTSAAWANAEIRAMLCRIAYPPLLSIGVLCNLLALLTFQQKRLRRSPVSLCLSTLAVLDSLVLLSSACRYWLKYQMNFDWQVQSVYLCKVSLFLEYFTADCSVWTLLLVTAQRYVGTHFPLRAGKLCNRSRTCVFLVAVFALAAVKNLPLPIRAKILPLPLAGPLCQIFYDRPLWVAFSWTDTAFRFLVPFPSLLFLNLSICRKVRAARRFRRNQLGESRSSIPALSVTNYHSTAAPGRRHSLSRKASNRVSRRAVSNDPATNECNRRISQTSIKQTNMDDGRRMLTMLVVVNFVFLACQIPYCTFSLVDSLLGLVKRAVACGDKATYLMLTLCFQSALTLVYVSHATNFFFYCLSGRLFRNTLLVMLRLRRRKRSQIRLPVPDGATHRRQLCSIACCCGSKT